MLYYGNITSQVIINTSSSFTQKFLPVTSQLSMKIDILEFQTFAAGNLHMHKFSPLHDEVQDSQDNNQSNNIEELDTIIVPANNDGFSEVFPGEDRWYAIQISSAMLEKIKYIAGYQTAPISAITYYAEVANIEKHGESDKFVVNFKGKAKKIEPLQLVSKGKIKALQGPRYTTLDKLISAKNLDEFLCEVPEWIML